MFLRFFAVSVVGMAACAEADEAAPYYYPSSLPRTNDQDVASGGLLACSPTAHLRESACTRSERALLAGDEAALGFTAEQLIQLVSDQHRAEVSWQVDGDASGRRSELLVAVRPQGDVRFVDQSLGSSGLGETITFGNTGGVYYTCGDHLAVDAELSVVMPDGSLDETIQATVVAESGRHARVLVHVPSASLVGTLRGAIEQGGSDQLTLALGFAELGTGLEGSLAASSSLGPSADPERGSSCRGLGTFSLAQQCPLGAYPLSAGSELLGLSFSGALARLNATSPATLVDNGTPLSLAFSADPAEQCVSIDMPATLPAVLQFSGSVSLESSDGRVGGTLEVQLRAEAQLGSLRTVSARSEYLVPDAGGLAELAPRYAIHEPLTWSPLELGGFEFLVEAHEQMAGGVLRAIGGSVRCTGSRPCEEVCPGPGCTVSPVEKWAVRWGELALGTGPSLREP